MLSFVRLTDHSSGGQLADTHGKLKEVVVTEWINTLQIKNYHYYYSSYFSTKQYIYIMLTL